MAEGKEQALPFLKMLQSCQKSKKPKVGNAMWRGGSKGELRASSHRLARRLTDPRGWWRSNLAHRGGLAGSWGAIADLSTGWLASQEPLALGEDLSSSVSHRMACPACGKQLLRASVLWFSAPAKSGGSRQGETSVVLQMKCP